MQSAGAAAPGARRVIAGAGPPAATNHADAQTRVYAVLTAAVALAAIIGLVVVAGQSTTGRSGATSTERPVASTVPGASPIARALAAWATRNLPHSAVIAARGDLAAALRSAGFSHVIAHPGGADYLVGVTGGTSVPVAKFGSRGGAVVVRQRVDVRYAARLWAADATGRRAAERELLRNFNVRTAPGARSALAAGRVDMRAATVLALLAGRGPVRLLAATPEPAEQAVGQPIRILELRVDSGAAQDIRAGLSAAYQPATVAHLPGGVQRWTWSLRALPPTTSTR